ncbi:MAG: diguanylate cyclase [Chitinispirillaceae bacterium]
MREKTFHRKMVIPAILLIAGICLVLLNGMVPRICSGLLIGTALISMIQSSIPQKRKYLTTSQLAAIRSKENTLPRIAEAQIADETSSIQPSCLGSEHRKQKWKQTETVVNEILDHFISLISSKLHYNTIAVFFPAPDNGYALRRFLSKSEHINRDSILIPKRGILGSLITEGLRPFYEPDFSSGNTTLYYYDEEYTYPQEENVRSVLVSPIEAGGVNRGILLVDNTEADSYTPEDHAYLNTLAKTLGQAVFFAYLTTEHKLEYQRLAAMSNIEKEFWRNLDYDYVMDRMTEIIPYAIPCDRLTISIKQENDPDAKIVRVYGEESEDFLDRTFFPGTNNSRSLVSMAYSKDFGFFRNFNPDHYEIRYNEDETQCSSFASFMAVPFGVDKCKGMILVESVRKDVFTNSNLDLLSRIATSVGLALEKIFVIRQADALATHDGLTGLYNHRHFQKILSQKISHCTRYNEPLSLILCDIDFFKKLNDNHGHPFGDKVLKGVASKLESSIRADIDAAARYGGEEFVLILDKTDQQKAKDTVERIRQGIASQIFKTSHGTDVTTTMSFGIAAYPEHARAANELISKADKALYSAKQNGRNRVEIF